MRISLEQPVLRWAAQFPRTVEAISTLHESGARAALSSSRLTHIVAEATGRVLLRKPDDTDLLIPHEDLGLAANLLGARVALDRRMTIPTGDGYVARFSADEVVSEADSIIQMVCPTSPMRVGHHRYDTSYTDFAAGAREVYETEYGLVPVATTDALYLYGILQREDGVKSDAHNTGILREVHPTIDRYAMSRASEMGLDNRVWSFVQLAGAAAAHPQVALAA
jgi:hypothetical protein